MLKSPAVLELDDVVVAVGAAREMALRAAAHPANVLNRLYCMGRSLGGCFAVGRPWF